VDYNVEYMPGPLNVIADACSRYPMLGPKQLVTEGLEFALEQLLAALPEDAKNIDNVWAYAAGI